MKDKKLIKKTASKVIHGLTPEERFKEIHGSIEEWSAKQEEKFIAKTGMTYDEWYVIQVRSSPPIEFLKKRNGTVTEDDVKLVKDLQVLELKDDVINVLLDYVTLVSRIGLIHPLVRKIGESWNEKNILTVERAIVFVREEQKKYEESSEKE